MSSLPRLEHRVERTPARLRLRAVGLRFPLFGYFQDANISATTQVSQSRELRERRIAFLNRIRDADPQGRTIDRALLNEQNELGLVLDRSVEMDKIPALMKTMLTQMAREFPAED